MKLGTNTKKAFETAVKTRQQAYAPYSKYKVGAAVVTDKGEVFGGCNVENASYGGTVCAERVAIFKALSEGHKKISEVVVVTEGEKLAPPCAFCLQVMAEFCSPNTKIWIASPKEIKQSYDFKDLLPHPFDPSYLK